MEAVPGVALHDFVNCDDSMMAHDGFTKESDVQTGQDPTVLRFRPIFTSLPFSKVSPGCKDGLDDAPEADMADDERPQSARTVDGYSRRRDLMDIDTVFPCAETSVDKSPRPLYGVHEDCIAHCLRFLPVRHLCLTSRVSRDLREACNFDPLWEKLCVVDFGPENAAVLMERYRDTVEEGTRSFFKEVYKRMLGFEIQLVFTSGPRKDDIQLVHANGPEGCMIGRSRQNNICILQDEMVSRKHAKISRSSHHYMINDVGSINGTFVNQKQLSKCQEQRLHFGDQVDMGNSIFTIELVPIDKGTNAEGAES